VFHSRYEILGPLGQGGMGIVYRARDRSLDEVVAIKILRPDFAQDARMAKRFKSEIRLARKVRHRNVCTIHDFGEEQGLVFISMEFIDGVDLKKAISRAGRGLPTGQAYDIVGQIAEGLEAVHEAGIIHRDLKTPNVMLDGRGVARLMDFGLAKQEHQEGGSATATGHVVGTPEYMSPEQAQGGRLDARCDIYALGVVAFEVFSGRVPFRGETPISTILKHLHEAPPLDGAEAAGIPPEVVPILRKALAKEPSRRYGSAREMADALRYARTRPSQQPAATEVMEAQTLSVSKPVTPARSVAAATTKATPAQPVAPAPSRRSTALPWGLLGLTVLGVAAVAFVLRDDFRAPSRPVPTLASASPTASPAPTTTPAPTSPEPPPTTLATPLPKPTASAKPRPVPPTTFSAVPLPTSPVPVPTAIETPPPRPSETPETGTGVLRVVARPWANVIVDGKPSGTTPLDRIELPAGVRNVRLEHPSYEPFETRVRIRPGETVRLDVDFPRQGVRKPQ
jgi:serine/threonine-protein kinase